jgi:uncharacterized protein
MRHRNRLVVAAMLALLWAGTGSEGRAAGRVALVIGNSDYTHATSLANPANDAADTAASLERLGFSVIRALNVDFNAFGQAIRTFNAQVQGAEIGLVYYAGHGVELGGENWLIPVDAELRTDVDVANESIGLKTLMQSVRQASGAGLVILDACRDNPFTAKMSRSKLTRSVDRGLARVEPTANVLVAYAAKDGTVAKDGTGRNSPFTAALLNNLETPGLDVGLLFRTVRDEVLSATRREQQPFVYGSLSSKPIYLKDPAPVSAPPYGPAMVGRAADETVWLAIRESTDPQLFENFLARFPASLHDADARSRLEELKVAGECDRVAGADIDRDRGRGIVVIEAGSLALETAARACEQAMRRFPEVARFAFQAGRAAEARQDYSGARQLYEQAAATGSAPAMLRLGFLHSEGGRLPTDYAQARQWYERAAAQNAAVALVNLGVLYESGRGGPQDYGKAFELYQKAAAAGDSHAMRNLGGLYESGRGVRRDYAQARRWYERAADLGERSAMASLAKLYERGLGVRKDAAAARMWNRKTEAAKEGDK